MVECFVFLRPLGLRLAKVVSSEEFARTVMETLREGPPASVPGDKKMSERELEEWTKLFENKKSDRSHVVL